jgi:hypothetical protein
MSDKEQRILVSEASTEELEAELEKRKQSEDEKINDLGDFGDINFTSLKVVRESKRSVKFHCNGVKLDATWFNAAELRELAERLEQIADLLEE